MTRYSTEKREAVLATYQERGQAAAAREHGVAQRTVWRWARAAGIVIDDNLKKATAAACLSNEQRREQVAERMADVAEQLVARVSDHLTTLPAGDVRALMTAAGIAIDKFVALTRRDPGKATDAQGVDAVTDEDRQRVENDIAAMIAAEAERIAAEAAGDYGDDEGDG